MGHPYSRLAQCLMMRVKQHQARALIKPPVGHHLINVGLRYALFWVIDSPCDPLPLGVNNQFDCPVTLDENVGLSLEQLGSITAFQAVETPALRHDLPARANQGAREHPGDIFLEHQESAIGMVAQEFNATREQIRQIIRDPKMRKTL